MEEEKRFLLAHALSQYNFSKIPKIPLTQSESRGIMIIHKGVIDALS